MIVRPRPHWLRLLFVRRGSLIGRIVPQLLFTTSLAAAVVLAHGTLFHWKVTLTATPFSLMGVALAIFLGFRINASYDRFWEARKLWGSVLIEVRDLARHAMSLPGGSGNGDARPFVLGLAGFAVVMRNQLREIAPDKDVAGLLPPALIERVRSARQPAALVLPWLAQWLRAYRDDGRQDFPLALVSEQALDRLSAALGGCERIAGTPLPFTYSVILHRTAYVYCMMLPFGLIDTIGLMTPAIVAFVSYTFFALEALSNELEEPFGRMPNALALDAIVATIETSLREMLGEPPVALPQPDENFVLS